MTPEWRNAVNRFVQHLPSGPEQTLVILKGHLLLEALVREAIDRKTTKPSALKAAQLEFFQCVCIAEALYSKEIVPWAWPALRKLNGVRNHLAHNLDLAGVPDKIAAFVTFVETNRDKSPGLRSVLKGTPLRLALGDLHSELLVVHPFEERNGA